MHEAESTAKSSISELWSRNRFSIAIVEQFPRRIHTTFGGNPCNTLKSTKSASFVTTTKPLSLACSQTKVSSAVPSPSKSRWSEFGYKSDNRLISFGDKFWSKSNLTLTPAPPANFSRGQRQTPNKPKRRRVSNTENRQEFPASSFLMPSIQEHHKPSFSFREYKACRRVCRVR